jgi:KTSC domain
MISGQPFTGKVTDIRVKTLWPIVGVVVAIAAIFAHAKTPVWSEDVAVNYHYCEIDAGTVSSLLGAESMGRFYNTSIKGRFDCRTHRVPAYISK